MFLAAYEFNQPIGNWNTSNATNMQNMLRYTPFNHPLNDWDVSNVTNMWGMFFGTTAFNHPIGNWNTSNVTSMREMFSQLPQSIQDNPLIFNQNLSNWDVSNVILCEDFSYGATSWTLPQPNFTNCNPN
jgi:surface protein